MMKLLQLFKQCFPLMWIRSKISPWSFVPSFGAGLSPESLESVAGILDTACFGRPTHSNRDWMMPPESVLLRLRGDQTHSTAPLDPPLRGMLEAIPATAPAAPAQTNLAVLASLVLRASRFRQDTALATLSRLLFSSLQTKLPQTALVRIALHTLLTARDPGAVLCLEAWVSRLPNPCCSGDCGFQALLDQRITHWGRLSEARPSGLRDLQEILLSCVTVLTNVKRPPEVSPTAFVRLLGHLSKFLKRTFSAVATIQETAEASSVWISPLEEIWADRPVSGRQFWMHPSTTSLQLALDTVLILMRRIQAQLSGNSALEGETREAAQILLQSLGQSLKSASGNPAAVVASRVHKTSAWDLLSPSFFSRCFQLCRGGLQTQTQGCWGCFVLQSPDSAARQLLRGAEHLVAENGPHFPLLERWWKDLCPHLQIPVLAEKIFAASGLRLLETRPFLGLSLIRDSSAVPLETQLRHCLNHLKKKKKQQTKERRTENAARVVGALAVVSSGASSSSESPPLEAGVIQKFFRRLDRLSKEDLGDWSEAFLLGLVARRLDPTGTIRRLHRHPAPSGAALDLFLPVLSLTSHELQLADAVLEIAAQIPEPRRQSPGEDSPLLPSLAELKSRWQFPGPSCASLCPSGCVSVPQKFRCISFPR